jgi:hypothetical protein
VSQSPEAAAGSFVESLMETDLYSMGAFFCDQHPDLVDEVVARGQGNPFFTTELVAAHLAGHAIPAVLSDLIAADLAVRVHRIGPATAIGHSRSAINRYR